MRPRMKHVLSQDMNEAMQVPALCNNGQPTEQSHNHVTKPWCWSIGSPFATRKCCAYPAELDIFSWPSLTITQVSTSSHPNMPSTMSFNNTHTTGMTVSTFLRDEKRSCKELQKKILSESHQSSANAVAQNADKSHKRTCQPPYPKAKASSSKPRTTEQKLAIRTSLQKSSGKRNAAVKCSKDT